MRLSPRLVRLLIERTFEFWSIANGGTLVDRYSLPEVATLDIPGDYNGDELVDVVDIDVQALAIDANPFISKFDENDDGLVNGSDRELWVHRHRQTYFGDANLDGGFDSDDLIRVFVAGEYEDGVFYNSTWSAGDWDGDRDFTSDDLVLALADGGYHRPARPAAVPEPTALTSMLAAAIALTSVSQIRRRSVREL